VRLQAATLGDGVTYGVRLRTRRPIEDPERQGEGKQARRCNKPYSTKSSAELLPRCGSNAMKMHGGVGVYVRRANL
jgi:hypothetical protein